MMNTTETSDQALINLIRGNDQEIGKALRYLELSEKRTLQIRKLVFSMGGKEQDYDEIWNDVLRAVYTSIIKKRFDDSYPIKSYMAGTARNLWYKRLRKMKSQGNVKEFSSDEQEPSFEIRMIEDERKKILVETLNRIGDKCKNILVKSRLEGYSYRELVEMTDYKNEAVIRKTVCECMKKLALLIEENPDLKKHLIL